MRIGIDLGGTKTEVIALDDAGEQRFRHRLPTPREDYQQTIETIATLVDMAEQATGQTGSVGIGIPGSLSPYTGVVKNANSTWLNGQPFDSDVSRRLKREVRLANDANCLAVSEAVDGAAAGGANGICGDYRYRVRRGRSAKWPGAHRRQRYGRRMGPQSVAVDG
ncbi:fructokinase [Salmonella enterica subsp. enterica]|nr:fructokinase [Salmonella enterica subsp. enterica]